MIRAGSRWSFPKGHVEPGETLLQAALRETREETGIEAALLEDYPLPVPSAREDDRRTVWFYPARYLAGDLCAQKSEVSEAGWIKISDAAKRITFAPDRAAFLKALEIMKISRVSKLLTGFSSGPQVVFGDVFAFL